MKKPLHILVAARYLEARRMSGPIRNAAVTLASNISTWLERQGPDVAHRLDSYPMQLRDIVPKANLEAVASRLQEAGVPVPAVALGWLKFQIVFTPSSFFSPQKKLIAISKPYSLHDWKRWLSRGGEFERSFLHEFVHAIDFLRGDPQVYDSDIKDDGTKYFTHDLEVNARIQELMLKYDRKLESYMAPLIFKKDSMDPEDLEWELLSHLGRTTRQEVQDLLLKLDPRLYDAMDSALRKRILKRIYTEVEEAKKRWRALMDFKP